MKWITNMTFDIDSMSKVILVLHFINKAKQFLYVLETFGHKPMLLKHMFLKTIS